SARRAFPASPLLSSRRERGWAWTSSAFCSVIRSERDTLTQVKRRRQPENKKFSRASTYEPPDPAIMTAAPAPAKIIALPAVACSRLPPTPSGHGGEPRNAPAPPRYTVSPSQGHETGGQNGASR